nr:unnamed protein product [Callosobruchus chinensis]
MAHLSRIIVLIDMDCFYCQVEEKLEPSMVGKPIAVVQYNPWRGGGIIAVNYPARDKGVTRHMRGDEAKQKCPDIVLARVPQVRGKADISKYREAGNRVAEVLQTFTNLLERASIDEAYLDITEAVEKKLNNNTCSIDATQMQNTFVVGYDTKEFIAMLNNHELSENNVKLAIGGLITEEIRAAVLERTGYKCSAGVAHNKVLAKLVCGLHKPNKQTVLPHDSVPILYKNMPVTKIKSLGGKFGQTLSEELNISFMWQLAQFSEKQLSQKFDEKTGHWLYNIARGIDNEPVTLRLVSKSIGCCKKFPGRTALTTTDDIEHWTSELASELSERLIKDQEQNNRKGKQIVVSFAQNDIHSSRTVPLNSYEQNKIAQCALAVINKFCQKPDQSYNVTFLGMSVGNFQEISQKSSIANFLMNLSKRKSLDPEKSDKNIHSTETTNSAPQEYPEQDEIAVVEEKSTKLDESDEKDRSNLSVYSATTEEMDIDTEDLIYYEDICPNSVSSQPIQRSVVSSQSSEELESSRKSSLQSFFVKYFDGETNQTEEAEHDEQLQDQQSEESSCKFQVSVPEAGQLTLSFSQPQNLNEENSVFCDVCDKRVRLENFGHHMDFHEAKAITKQETHVNKSGKSTSDSKTKNKAIAKRKSTEKLKPISSFLVAPESLDETNSDMCLECNKRIKFSDVASHSDYHVAKKLHEEMNARPVPKDTVPSTCKKRKPDTNGKAITNFFKNHFQL